MRVTADGGEVGVAEVLGDEAGVAEFLAEPGCCCVAERVRCDVLLESRPFGCTADDLREDRLLESPPGEAAEDRRLGTRAAFGSESTKLACEAGWERLSPGLAAFAAADEERRCRGVEVEVAPVEPAELGAA